MGEMAVFVVQYRIARFGAFTQYPGVDRWGLSVSAPHNDSD
jgi:hypothetical protein